MGIFPLNVDVLPASKFAPSILTDQLLLPSNSDQALDVATPLSVYVSSHTSTGLTEDRALGFECLNVDPKRNAIVTHDFENRDQFVIETDNFNPSRHNDDLSSCCCMTNNYICPLVIESLPKTPPQKSVKKEE